MNKKIIFLDIDGVLNRATTEEKCGPYTGCDLALASMLMEWKPLDVSIVLSSTWRNHPEMHEHLHSAGITWIDVTPKFNKDRGYEIKDWLDRHPHVEKYVILDDSTDMLFEQLPFFVNTDHDTGLTVQDLAKASAILN